SSLVQRFGRCNRKGEYKNAEVYWLDLPNNEAAPYEPEELAAARERLKLLSGQSVAAALLPHFEEPVRHHAVLRRRDLLGLFDTSADLSGSYLDVSRFVRGDRDADVSVFWRTWEGAEPPANLSAPDSEELCSVPLTEVKDLLDGKQGRRDRAKVETDESDGTSTGESDAGNGDTAAAVGRVGRRKLAWRWSHVLGRWERLGPREVCAGMTILLHVNTGGYRTDRGWDAKATEPVPPVASVDDGVLLESIDDEVSNIGLPAWIPLRMHSLRVRYEVTRLLQTLVDLCLPAEAQSALITAAHYHDLGKAHPVFQETMLSNLSAEERERRATVLWAKQGTGSQPGTHHKRPHFRHEVASAVAALALDTGLRGRAVDLCAYLAAAHHGKVRLAMRSLPRSRDQAPDNHYLLLGFPVLPDEKRARGATDLGDTLPPVDLGGGVTTEEVTVNLSMARMGASPDGEYSWLERALGLLEWLGPFCLAYLEALLRAADARVSKVEQQEGGQEHG
ncbi:MAG: CRISPR-associated endonuclease Cas3'', partial [Chloroflexota bacterium]